MEVQKSVQMVQQIFEEKFGAGSRILIGQAPGRVNLIGEHTDYNDGFVFPMALDFKMTMAARKRNDQLVKIYSIDHQEQVEFELNGAIFHDQKATWSNYLRGVMEILRQAGVELCGVEIAFHGDVPQGAGLSSSAALEVVTVVVLQALIGFKFTPLELAKLCQKAENQFVGMNCGIMDQFISMMGEENHALFLDCRSLEYQQVPLELDDCRIVICHSGVKHSLVDSEYNQRRKECEAVVTALQNAFPEIKALRDANLSQLAAVCERITETEYQRAYHVISEDNRVLESITALKAGNLVEFGNLMNASHDSLRDDYQVSCSEIDLLVELARVVPGVLGSRITGGGFGGCTVNLIKAAAIPEFTEKLAQEYQAQTGIKPRFYISTAANGAKIL